MSSWLELLKEPSSVDILIYLVVVVAVLRMFCDIVNWVWDRYSEFLWKGMDEEKRYFYIKVARW